MKQPYIVLFILLLLLLVSCSKKEELAPCPECQNCQPHIDMKTQLLNENNALKNKVSNLTRICTENPIGATQCVNNTTVLYNNTNCMAYVRTIENQERRLAECYNMNQTFNTTYKERFDICENKIDDILDIIDS